MKRLEWIKHIEKIEDDRITKLLTPYRLWERSRTACYKQQIIDQGEDGLSKDGTG